MTGLGLSDGPVAKNLPYNAGHVGSIPDQGTKIPQATKQLYLHAIAGESVLQCPCMIQLRPQIA